MMSLMSDTVAEYASENSFTFFTMSSATYEKKPSHTLCGVYPCARNVCLVATSVA